MKPLRLTRIRTTLVPLLAALALLCPGATVPALALPPTESWSADLSATDSDDANVAVSAGAVRLAGGSARASSAGVPRALGMLVLAPRRLASPADRFTADVTADLPAGSEVFVDVRGLRTGGGWTQWTEAHRAAPGLLGEPSSEVQVRLVLLAGHGGASPAVRALRMTADRTVRLGLDLGIGAPERALSYPIFATREGLVGRTTANGHRIVERDHFVALPSRRGLSARGRGEYSVKVCAGNGRCSWAPVWDVGPWNTTDDYWSPSGIRQSWRDLPQGRPQADAAHRDGYNGGRDQFGRRVANPAGIDLADGTFWDALQLRDNSWVHVTYLWTGRGLSGTVRTYGTPLHVRNGTNRSARAVGLAGNHAQVLVECEARGGMATGTQGTTDIWLRIGPNQHVAKAYVQAPPAPPC